VVDLQELIVVISMEYHRPCTSEKKVPPIIRDKFLIIGSEKAQDVNTVVVYANEHFIHPCLKLIDPNVKIHEGRSAGCKAQYKTPNFCYGYQIIENPR